MSAIKSTAAEKTNEKSNEKNSILKAIPYISLIISLFSLYISYKNLNLNSLNYRPYFICSTEAVIDDNLSYPYYKNYLITNLGASIKNIDIDIKRVIVLEIDGTGESKEILLTNDTPEHYHILNKNIYEYDYENNSFAINDLPFLYDTKSLEEIVEYFIENSVYYLKDSEPLSAINFICKRYISVSYNDITNKRQSAFYVVSDYRIEEISEKQWNYFPLNIDIYDIEEPSYSSFMNLINAAGLSDYLIIPD